jgi:hypothetical protein
MPINRRNHRKFHTTLYATQLQRLYLIKREPDQRQGVQRTLLLFQCRRGQTSTTGQPLNRDFTSNERCTWHIPREELDRVGVEYISAIDRFVDPEDQTGPRGATWMPESGTSIRIKLFGNHVCVDCLRTDDAGV